MIYQPHSMGEDRALSLDMDCVSIILGLRIGAVTSAVLALILFLLCKRPRGEMTYRTITIHNMRSRTPSVSSCHTKLVGVDVGRQLELGKRRRWEIQLPAIV
ncbi:hypothetical protein PRIPAC_80722 [Pristionchus pacificus]|uniref:Uncharacterized protein n=1 Tax=Pristionchus pacificus TaxID=54126 RepID=A0A2A6CMR6_PRIPA|nr:hypothetical protein PRIPAC_80722 [Pristionchus pacificus]|eukprot:PDM79390.1 hypothetical protein PRIPAC_31969 [Pristionchus pacificus]